MTELTPLTPPEANSYYLDEHEPELSTATIEETYKPALNEFVVWAEEVGLDNLNDLDGRMLRDYRQWLKNNSEKNTVTLNGHLGVIRTFFEFCVEIEAVSESLPDKVPIPNVPDDEDVCKEKPANWLVDSLKGRFIGSNHPPEQPLNFSLSQR
ncbi:site-specific integrase [Haloarculaceae archaeon H-GB11]|nr:site-specific integrase [Haloarculaceae archaeon H-GB11]